MIVAAATAWAGYDTVLSEAIAHHREALTLADAPPIYHLRYQVLELGQVDVRASMGSLVSANHGTYHALGVEVRVGDPSFDNTGFGGWQNGFARAQLPEVLTETALANEVWRTTDAAYKEAVEQYARKRSQFEPPPDWPGDYTLTGPVTADLGGARPEAAPDRLIALAKGMSAELTTTEALLAEVHVGHEAGWLWTVDSEGTSVKVPVEETTIRAMLQVRAEDGQLLTDQRLFTVRAVDALPDDRELFSAVRRMREGLLAAAHAPALTEEYVGPVLFEDGAAADLFRYVLVSQLEGTPAEIPFDSWFGELGADRDPVRVGRRVLPVGWSVVDDPTALPKHPGAYTYDQEGTRTRELHLVADGIVKTLAMSRVPRRGLTETNGHARGFVGERAAGRLTLYTVSPARTLSAPKLERAAAKAARAYDRDWWLVVRRLQEPAVVSFQTDVFWDDTEALLPPPVAVVRRYADGREELLRGAAFAGVERWILRDIAAAGAPVEADYMAPLGEGGYGSLSPTEGVASHVKAPVVLVGEAELVPSSGDPTDVPVVPPPEAPPVAVEP